MNANILPGYAEANRRRPGREKRMRQFGKVAIPQEAFIAALKVDV